MVAVQCQLTRHSREARFSESFNFTLGVHMPFKCNLTLGESLQSNDKVEFVGWVDTAWNSGSEWGHIFPDNTPYAIVKIDGELGKIYTTFRGALMEKGKLHTGEIINSNTILAIVAAEGDEIAYGKPSSVFKKNT